MTGSMPDVAALWDTHRAAVDAIKCSATPPTLRWRISLTDWHALARTLVAHPTDTVTTVAAQYDTFTHDWMLFGTPVDIAPDGTPPTLALICDRRSAA